MTPPGSAPVYKELYQYCLYTDSKWRLVLTYTTYFGNLHGGKRHADTLLYICCITPFILLIVYARQYINIYHSTPFRTRQCKVRGFIHSSPRTEQKTIATKTARLVIAVYMHGPILMMDLFPLTQTCLLTIYTYKPVDLSFLWFFVEKSCLPNIEKSCLPFLLRACCYSHITVACPCLVTMAFCLIPCYLLMVLTTLHFVSLLSG